MTKPGSRYIPLIAGAALAAAVPMVPTAPARAQHVELTATATVAAETAPPIPPNVEAPPVAVRGGYCYAGPHPVDTRVDASSGAWDGHRGRHVHAYPPIDLRLFALSDGCYHFVGDPTDFGYRGQVYNYYGAHPVHHTYGGGWCFMVGGHGHWWGPWSSSFVVMGPWFYWHGPYDPFFWSYWPYYSYYYRAYYPHYYGGGRFHRGRGRDHQVAPPIRNVPAPAAAEPWRGAPAAAAPMGGSTAPRTIGRGAAAGGAMGAGLAPDFGGNAPSRWRGGAVAPGVGVPRGDLPAQPANTFRAAPTAPTFHGGAGLPASRGGSFGSGLPAPSFRGAPAPSFRGAPAPSFRGAPGGSAGGGFRDNRRR
jgi:hypothetical protein